MDGRIVKATGAAFALALALAPAGAIARGGLTQADFEACHRTAMAAAGVSGSGSWPSASPQMPGTTPGAPSTRPGERPDLGQTPGAPSTRPGERGDGTGSGAPGTGTQREPAIPGPGAQGPSSGSGGTPPSASPGGQTGSEAQLDAIVQAYRDCLKPRM